MHDPKVFLLDEPLSNLDAKLRVEVRSLLKRIQREKVGIGDVREAKPGQKVSLGIRPKDISLKGEIEGRVTLIEPIGSIMYLTVNFGSREIVVKASIGSNPDVGDKVSIGFPTTALHLFD